MIVKSRYLLLLLLMMSFPLQARFINNGNGTTSETITGLMWQRCPYETPFVNGECQPTNEPNESDWNKYNYTSALTKTSNFAGYTDWRLPTVREAMTILGPEINTNFFRLNSTNEISFWTSSWHPYGHWITYQDVGFSGSNYSYNTTPRAIRFVRGTTPPALVDSRPTTDYINHGDGTITHIPTQLMWKQCPEKTGSTVCNTTVPGTKYTYAQAVQFAAQSYAGYSDWRLPTLAEVYSLLDLTKANNTFPLNTIFTGLKTEYVLINDTTSAPFYRYMSLSDKTEYGTDSTSPYFSVRLVRGGIPPEVAITYNLFVEATSPDGESMWGHSGLVTSSPAGIICPDDCVNIYDIDTVITLTARSDEHVIFHGWNNGCTGTTCSVTMDANKTVEASFSILRDLLVTNFGNGTVSSSETNAQINCGSDCSGLYGVHDVITLLATPNPGYLFDYWEGGCISRNDCVLHMYYPQTVGAHFVKGSELTVQLPGDGEGRVTCNGVDCFTYYGRTYYKNTPVNLTANPNSGSIFTGWSGACSGIGACNVAMASDMTVTANFRKIWDVAITKSGNGSGIVTAPGIYCGVDCGETVTNGTQLTLKAEPAQFSKFELWSEPTCGTNPTCVINVTRKRDINAIFFGIMPMYQLSVTKIGTGSGTVEIK